MPRPRTAHALSALTLALPVCAGHARQPIPSPDASWTAPTPHAGSWCATLADEGAGTTIPRAPRLRPMDADAHRRAGARGPCTEDGSRLDILIVYTPTVLANQGGLSGVQTLAADAVAELNLVFTNSGIPTTAVLAGLREVSYTETGNLSTDLARLREPADGVIDGVHTWRNDDRADLVCMLVQSAGVLGIANLAVQAGYQPRPDLAFSVVQASTIGSGNPVFSHEIGHNLGLLHQSEADPCVLAGADTNGHGYAEPGGAFQTVMATGGAPAELRFSDPGVLVGGLPAGVPGDAENALVAAQSVVVASRFRNRDQDNNGVCDADQIAADPALDCNANGILDQFETDLNGNGVPDDCDIASGTSLDLDLDGVPDEAELARIYVDADAAPGGDGATWATAMHDLQDALALARACLDTTEIWIAEGTYTPGPYKADKFDLVGGVALLGGFNATETLESERNPDAHPTVLSGDLAGDDDGEFTFRDDNSVTVCYAYAETGTITLDGLTITGGHSAEPYGCQAGGTGTANGGGLFALFSDIRLNNCTVLRNGANDGGGLFLPDVTSWGLTDVDVIGNRAIGFGGEVGGAYLTAAKLPGNVTRCRFNGNHADGSVGGVFFIGGAPIVTDSEFIGNSSGTYGRAGLYGRLLDGAVFSNITVAYNINLSYAVPAGARFDTSNTNTTISNSVFWDNYVYHSSGSRLGDQQATIQYFDGVTVANTTVQYWSGLTPGIDTNGDDPLLTDDLGPDLTQATGDEDARPAPGSPAIDSGDDTLTFSTLDLDGSPRFVGTVDRGAYEAQPPACPADVNLDGILDNGDIGAFVNAFLAGQPIADFTGDGILDNGDIGAFVAAFLAGC
ncbi:MAG: M12 family metallo-peptidase [Phycisphaerales bacterium JB040]